MLVLVAPGKASSHLLTHPGLPRAAKQGQSCSASASGRWAEMGGSEELSYSVPEPLQLHPEHLVWGQPLFRGGLSAGGDVG